MNFIYLHYHTNIITVHEQSATLTIIDLKTKIKKLFIYELSIILRFFWYSSQNARTTWLQVKKLLLRPLEDPLDIPFLCLDSEIID